MAGPHLSEDLHAVPQDHNQVVDYDGTDDANQLPAEPHASIYVVHESIEQGQVHEDVEEAALVHEVLLVDD